jgi:hypothetical protein
LWRWCLVCFGFDQFLCHFCQASLQLINFVTDTITAIAGGIADADLVAQTVTRGFLNRVL